MEGLVEMAMLIKLTGLMIMGLVQQEGRQVEEVVEVMQEIYILIEEINYSNSGILIQGESGTGKELVANAVQQTSQRKKKPFIKVNCSVFPHDLLASELFGHVKGAYTDAHRDRIGSSRSFFD